MKLKVLLILLTGFMFCKNGFSQIQFSFGPEVGINSSLLPQKYSYSYTSSPGNDVTKITNNAVINPVLGIWAKAKYGKHFFTNVGAQYLWVGNNYESRRNGIDYLGKPFLSYKWEEQTFQKLSIPIAVGYEFKIGKIKPNIFLGLKKEYFTQGNYNYSAVYYVEDGSDKNLYREYSANPFDKETFTSPAKRWNNSVFLGLGAEINEKLSFNLSYSKNQWIEYGNTFSWEYYGYIYHNNDLAFTMRYNIMPVKH